MMDVAATPPAASYDNYVKWDEARKKRFPQATHWIYQSRIGDFKVAEWCALSGLNSIVERRTYGPARRNPSRG